MNFKLTLIMAGTLLIFDIHKIINEINLVFLKVLINIFKSNYEKSRGLKS